MTTIISYSEVFKWQTCQRQYYYKNILGRSPIEMSDAITTGVNGHKLLEVFYGLIREGKSKEEAWLLTTQKANKLVGKGGATDFNLLKAWTLIDNYIRETEFTSEAVLIENRFLFPASMLDADPILADVQIGFTPDIVFERKGKKLDIEDYKFVARAWSKSKKNRFPQLKLYQIFMEQMGYEISRTTLRFFNTTTAKIEVQNYTMYGDEKAILTRDFMSGVKEIVRYKDGPKELLALAPRTMAYTACQFCAFEQPCTLEGQGKSAAKTLETQYLESEYDYNR